MVDLAVRRVRDRDGSRAQGRGSIDGRRGRHRWARAFPRRAAAGSRDGMRRSVSRHRRERSAARRGARSREGHRGSEARSGPLREAGVRRRSGLRRSRPRRDLGLAARRHHHEGRPARRRRRALARGGRRSRGLEGAAARARDGPQEREGAAVPFPARDHEGEEEGNSRTRVERARRRRLRAHLDGRLDGAAAGTRRRQDPQGRRRQADRAAARDGAARRGEGPVKTLVVAERKGTDLRRVTLEITAKARELGEATVVEIAGERYSALPFVSALAKKVESEKPDLVLLGATLNGRDLGARLAARLGRGYAADVTDIRAAGNALELDKPMYAGKVRAKLRLDLPAVVSVRPGAMPLKEGAEAPQVEKIDADASAEKLTFVKLAATATATKRVSLSEARVVVSGGRGLKGPENWHLVEER